MKLGEWEISVETEEEKDGIWCDVSGPPTSTLFMKKGEIWFADEVDADLHETFFGFHASIEETTLLRDKLTDALEQCTKEAA
jgi:hypothetical protein